MSVPARHPVVRAAALRGPRPRTHPPPRPSHGPSAAPPDPTPPQIARRAPRRRHHPAFWLFAAVVVVHPGVGRGGAERVVGADHVPDADRAAAGASTSAEQQVQLSDQVASLSSPERVARLGRMIIRLAMPQPGDTSSSPVPGVGLRPPTRTRGAPA